MIVFLARHAESVLNLEGRVNGDPAVPVTLTERGRDEARLLGAQLANAELDLCVHTRFPRTRETAELALGDRRVPVEVEPLLDDIKIGELDGEPLARYREVKRGLGPQAAFPGRREPRRRRAPLRRGLRPVWQGRRRSASSSSATRFPSGTR